MPNYSIRKSNRAKYLRIKVSLEQGVEVVVPRRTSLKTARQFLNQHQEWILNQLDILKPHGTPSLPERIFLQALGETWKVNYQFGLPQDHYQITASYPDLHLSGSGTDPTAAKKKLQHWLRNKAKQSFHDWIQQISLQADLSFNRLVIRSQKTRWGSCSSKGTINLNDRLMFLPRETVDYVMLHELCHTRHMNHSRQFWQLVESYCPHYREHESALKIACQHIPAWTY